MLHIYIYYIRIIYPVTNRGREQAVENKNTYSTLWSTQAVCETERYISLTVVDQPLETTRGQG